MHSVCNFVYSRIIFIKWRRCSSADGNAVFCKWIIILSLRLDQPMMNAVWFTSCMWRNAVVPKELPKSCFPKKRAHMNCELLIANVKFIQAVQMSGVLEFMWHHIDVVENSVTFLAHPVHPHVFIWNKWSKIEVSNRRSWVRDSAVSTTCSYGYGYD